MIPSLSKLVKPMRYFQILINAGTMTQLAVLETSQETLEVDLQKDNGTHRPFQVPLWAWALNNSKWLLNTSDDYSSELG